MALLELAIVAVLAATLARGAQAPSASGLVPPAAGPQAPAAAAGEIANQKPPIENPLDRRRAEFELRRRQAQLDRCRERLARYQKELASLGTAVPPSLEEPDEPSDATVVVRCVTDRHGRTVYAVEADRATLQAVLEALATQARADLLLDQGVSVRDLSAFLSVALDGVTLRQALELVLGGFDLDFTLADGRLAVTLPSKGPYRTAEERLRQRAERAYQAALVEFPNGSLAPRAHLTLGQYFHARQLHTQAIEQLGRLVRDYPRSEQVPAALYTLGESYRALGDLKSATPAYRSIVLQHPRSPFAEDALLALARGHMAAREHAKAIPLLEELLANTGDGGNAEGQMPKAEPLPSAKSSHASPHSSFVIRHSSLASSSPLRLEASLLLSECLLAAGRQAEALTRLDSLLAGELPADVERRARLLAARALMDAGDYAKARAAFYRLAGKFPATAEGGEARYLLAETYLRENAALAAVEAYRGALASLPKAPQAEDATFRLAKLYQQMTLYDLAIDTCERLLADQEREGVKGVESGGWRVEGGAQDKEKADKSAAAPSTLHPPPSTLHSPRSHVPRRAVLQTLAECCADQGNLLKAQHCFERAAEGARDPEAWQALFQAAHAAIADQRPADALPLVQRVADQAPDKALVAQALNTLGDCHRQLGRLDAALATYRRAAQAAEKGGKP